MSSVLDRHIIFEDPHGGDNNHGSGLIDDGSDGDDDDDDARVSRLFYLQLYSSVLKAEREAERLRREQRKKNKRKKIAPASLPKLVKSLSWVDVTRLMGGDSNKKRRRDGVSMTSATDMDVEQQLTQTLPVQGGGKKVSRIQVRRIEPVLNTRMKTLSSTSNGINSASNFSLHYRHPSDQVIVHKSRSCSPRLLLRSNVCLGVTVVSIALIFFMIFNWPSTEDSFYEVARLAVDPSPGDRPRIALCLAVPFSAAKLREFSVSPRLASFLLYSLSPFHPKRDILDDQDLLEKLTEEYRDLLARFAASRRIRKSGPVGRGGFAGVRRLLRALSPRCSDIVSACRVGDAGFARVSGRYGGLLRGDACCRAIFSRVELGLRGLCLVAPDVSRLTTAPGEFPVTDPGSSAHLTVLLNASAASEVNVDSRVAPWAAESGVTVALANQEDGFAYRDLDRDIPIPAGQTVSLSVRKRVLDASLPWSRLLSSGCASAAATKSAASAQCRGAALQAIAEKSVNCSLPLPRSDRSLRACGPLEALALAYVLREQGSLVSTDPKLMDAFEESLNERCPPEDDCRKTEFVSDTVRFFNGISNSVTFGVSDPSTVSVLDISYRAPQGRDLVEVARYRSGVIAMLYRLGSLCGIGMVLLCACVAAKRACARRKGLLFRRRLDYSDRVSNLSMN